jgi:hypothetical protein
LLLLFVYTKLNFKKKKYIYFGKGYESSFYRLQIILYKSFYMFVSKPLSQTLYSYCSTKKEQKNTQSSTEQKIYSFTKYYTA